MSEATRDDGRLADRVFRPLHDRPAPELDAEQMWQRLETQLAPRAPRSWWLRLPALAGRLAPPSRRPTVASSLAGAAFLALLVWISAAYLFRAQPAAQLVLLESPGATDAVGALGASGSSVVLDIRLVRGFDGSVPADVAAVDAGGAGGADTLGDVRARIGALLPFEQFGMVGAWEGTLQPGEPVRAELSQTYSLTARSAVSIAAPSDMVRLEAVELGGTGQGLKSADLALEPGRTYLIGVLPPGAEAPSLILVVRARVGAAEER